MNIIKVIGDILRGYLFSKYYKDSAPKNLYQCFERSFVIFSRLLIGLAVLVGLGRYFAYLGLCSLSPYISKWLILFYFFASGIVTPFIQYYYTCNNTKQQKKD